MVKRITESKKSFSFSKKFIKIGLKVDKQIANYYSKIISCFFGKMLVKLVSEIVLALLIAAFTYLATSIYYNKTAFLETNNKLQQIYISVSDEYVNSLFGIPYATLTEAEDLIDNFYVVDDAVILRTVSKDNKVIAFFVSSTNERRKIPLNTYNDTVIIGETVYASSGYDDEQREAFCSGDKTLNYYYEMQGTGRYGMYNYYLYGTAPYGFLNKKSVELVKTVGLDKNVDQSLIDNMRKEVKPNTYGVIQEGYQDVVSILPTCDEWMNIYYLLNNITD